MGEWVSITSTQKQHAPSIWRKLLGWACIALGLVGIILPIIPGIPLLMLGTMILATQHRWAHQVLVWAKRRFHSSHFRHGGSEDPHSSISDSEKRAYMRREK